MLDTDRHFLSRLVVEVVDELFVVGKFEHSEDVFVVFEGDSEQADHLFNCAWFGVVCRFAT